MFKHLFERRVGRCVGGRFWLAAGMDSAVVTGAGRGIGRGIAELLVSRGYAVVVTDVDGDAARRTAGEVGAVAGLAQDVRDEAVARAGGRGGARATAAHGLGQQRRGRATTARCAGVDVGARRRARRREPQGRAVGDAGRARRRSGRAGETSSTSPPRPGLGPVPGLAVYAATKAAVVSVTMSASVEAPRGVRVHALCPDGVATAMVAAMDPDGPAKAIVHSSRPAARPSRRWPAAAVALVGSRRVVPHAAGLARRADPARPARCPRSPRPASGCSSWSAAG